MSISTHPLLQAFLNRWQPGSTEQETWGDMPLTITAYACGEMPPEAWITSVRGIIRRDDEVLVVENRDGVHVLPGGRREKDESLLATVRREVAEETGWRIKEARLIGFIHFHHLSPKPKDYPYLHPDFVQVVYRADANYYDPMPPDVYETRSGFRPFADAEALSLRACDRLFLRLLKQEGVS